jgi:hypothetical protein
MLFIEQWSWTTFINIIYSMELSHHGLSKWSLFVLIHASLIIIIVRKCKSRDHLTSSSTKFLICICIWYVVEPNYGFYTTGIETAPIAVFIGADSLERSNMLLRNLHARHCLADGSNELRCPQRKNVGTVVSCSLVIQVLLYYCMYVSLLYLMLYDL